MYKNKKIIFIILLFVLFLGLKLGHLRADPPVNLSWSGGVFGDEGAHAHNARNKILFGKWITDDWNPMFYNPFLTALEYCSFLLLGPGLTALRLVITIFTFLGLVFLYLGLCKVSPGAALFSLLLLGTNYIYLMYTRLGLTDSFMSAALLIAFFFWQKGVEKEKNLFAAGIACFAVYVCKGTAIYFIIASVISLFFALIQKNEGKRFRQMLPGLIYFFSGFFLAVILWFFIFYLPHRPYFSAYGQTWIRKAMPESWARLWQNLSRPKIFYLAKTPVIFLMPLFYLPFFLYNLVNRWRKILPAEFFAWLWWGGGIIFLSSLNYNPLRYFISLIPAFCLLTAFSLDKMIKGEVFFKKKPGIFFWVLTSLWTALVIKLIFRFFTLRQIISPAMVFFISFLSISLIVYLILSIIFISGRKIKIKLLTVKLFVSALLLVSVLTNGYRYLDWFIHPRYTVINASGEINGLLKDAYLAGLWAPLLCLETSNRALYLGEGNEKKTFSRYPITHLILWDGNNRQELRMIEKNYPEVRERTEQIKVFNIKEQPVRLFEIVDGDTQ